MNTFRIYKHPLLGWAAVKVGFNWFAFFLGVLWLLSVRLWKHAAIFFVIAFVYNFLTIPDAIPDGQAPEIVGEPIRESSPPIMDLIGLAVTLGISWFIGNNGNRWRRINLKSRGYVLINSVEADNKDAALALADKAYADEILSENEQDSDTEKDTEKDAEKDTEKDTAVEKQIK